MAALSEIGITGLPAPRIVELRHVRPDDLDAILDEEARVWNNLLHWDFAPSADLVRRFVGMQALSGCALWVGDRPAGYAYFVCEDRKGLIGDLYVLEEFRTAENEARLLSAVLEA